MDERGCFEYSPTKVELCKQVELKHNTKRTTKGWDRRTFIQGV